VELRRLIVEDFATYLVAFFLFVYLAALEWMRLFFHLQPFPKEMTFVAVIACGYTSMKMFRIRKQLRNLKQGMEGEKAVGQYLERLREKGCQILHDIPGENFNIDHLLVGRAGIYVIETKTISKPQSGKAVIEYNGKELKVNGFTPDRNPIARPSAGPWERGMPVRY
jgi:hypothetical protein